jgi:high-affinity iron transporter
VLPTFVIGLREGLEAALIVGIIAAFLRQQGASRHLRQVWLGVGLALVLCFGIGVALRLLDDELPQRQQEGLETIVGSVAVLMVTGMVVWMRRHAPTLKRDLQGAATQALENGTATALVFMAFFAVLREGIETAVFLLAAFNASTRPAQAGGGALLGVLVAAGLGYGLYRGGVKINLQRFFRVTGLVLVLVAAGLVATALHTAHEAAWLNAGQAQAFDMSAIVRPGTVVSSILTGTLGWQPYPVVVEVVGWALYFVPVALFVLWPQKRRPAPKPAPATLDAAAV